MELERWFASLSGDGSPQLERLGEHERSLPVVELLGRRGFFTDANACLSRAAWERVPFREVAYAEDRVLAIDMLRAGYAKVFVPAAAVLHSHDYSTAQELRRCFDEWRGLREVYGWREPASPAHMLRQLRGQLGQARRELSSAGVPAAERRATLAAVSRHHVARLTGAVLGSRADLLPPRVAAPAVAGAARGLCAARPRRDRRSTQSTGARSVTPDDAPDPRPPIAQPEAIAEQRPRRQLQRAARGLAPADLPDLPLPRLAHAAVPRSSRSRCASRR